MLPCTIAPSAKMKTAIVALTLFFVAQFVMADDTAPKPDFPPIPQATDAQTPLLVQLSCPADKVRYRKPIPLFVRFTNTGEDTVRVPLSASYPSGGPASVLKWHIEDPNSKRSIPVPWIANSRSGRVLLSPGKSITVQLTDRLLPPGRHNVSVTYLYTKDSGLDQSPPAKIKSNKIDIQVVKKPLSEQRKRALTKKMERLVKENMSRPSYEDPAIKSFVQTQLLIGSPFSVPPLKKALTGSNSVAVRKRCAEALGNIANKRIAQQFGIVRDTTAGGTILTILQKDVDPRLTTALINAIWWFRDVLNNKQKTRLRTRLIELLDSQNQQVRFWAAFHLLRMFPQTRERVKNKMEKSDFVNTGQLSTLKEEMRDAKQEENQQ